ncbi:hypothetical protein NQ317_010641 [Molorchus minor]|uniref:Uncharacterized protein n=1 Tax=Molorchus minor TaxID=1323400 RepID=A0ABQ9IUK5_9CUCU|nr:hypothetical protein NQ317_010641 [Molorchus minor]
MKTLLDKLLNIEVENNLYLKSLDGRLKTLEGKHYHLREASLQEQIFGAESLPLKTEEQLNEFEEKLTDKEVAAKLENFCHSVGVKTINTRWNEFSPKFLRMFLQKNVHGLATVIAYP